MTYNSVFDQSLRAEYPFTISTELRDAFVHKYPQLISTTSSAVESPVAFENRETEVTIGHDQAEMLIG